MRIVSGTYRSRIIKAVPGDHTRPTLDKVKEAVFSRIGPYFEGGEMLDLFAGSGNMGLEACSRGMKHVIFADKNNLAIRTIKENINALGVQGCDIWKSDYKAVLQRCVEEGKIFDLIYLDPPYALKAIPYILSTIDQHNLLREDGVIVCESLKEETFSDDFKSFYKSKEAQYGITKITYYDGGRQ